MAHPSRVLALLLLLALLAPGAVAQEGGIRLTLTPASLTLSPATNGTTTVTVTNDGLAPADVQISASNATSGLNVSFSATTLSLLPGRSGSVTAYVRAAEEGVYSVLVHATARAAVGASMGNATARLDVAVRANATAPPGANATAENEGGAPLANATSPPAENETSPSREDEAERPPVKETAPPAPRVDAQDLTLVARPREAVGFRVDVRNEGASEATYGLLLRLPIGWGGRLDDTSVLVPAHGSATIRGAVQPTDDARDAEAELEVRGEGGRTLVRLHLQVERPPPADVASPPPEEVVADDTGDANAPDDPAPTASSPPALTLELLARDLGAPPGANVVLTAYVENTGARPAQARLAAFAPALRVEPAELTAAVPAGARVAVAFTLAVPEDAAFGTVFDGALTLDDGAPVSFAVTASASETLAAVVVSAPDETASVLGALAGVAVGAAVAMAAWRRWPGFGLVALYARLAPRRALEHPRRARMMDALRASPGLTLAQLQRATGLSNGVARHHVALLQAAGALRVVRDGASRRLWPTDAPNVAGAPALGERVVACLAERGPMRASDLAAELGVSRQALHYHLKKLQREGRVVARRERAGVVVEPAAS